MHVIFICTGNICRSAMADGYLKYRIKELGKEQDITVNSAGTHAIENQESPINAKKAIEKYGANINSHTATTLERANLEKATHISDYAASTVIDRSGFGIIMGYK